MNGTNGQTEVEKVEDIERQKEAAICAMFGVKDADAVSRGALQTCVLKQRAVIESLVRQCDSVMVELYCADSKNVFFTKAPPQVLERFKKIRAERNRGKIIIPKMVIGGRK